MNTSTTKKVISYIILLTLMMAVIATNSSFSFAENSTIDDTIVEKMIKKASKDNDDISIVAAKDTVNYIEQAGFKVESVAINKKNEPVLKTEISNIHSKITITSANNEEVEISVVEGKKQNIVTFLDDGRTLIDGEEVVSEDVSSSELEVCGRAIGYQKTAPKPTKASQYKTHATKKRNISFGEKLVKNMAMGAFILAVGKELGAAGYISVKVADWGGMALGSIYTALGTAKANACSVKNVIKYYKGKYKVNNLLSVQYCETTFYEKKNQKGQIGKTRKVYECSWLSTSK